MNSKLRKTNKWKIVFFVCFCLMSFVTILFAPLDKAVAFSVIDDGMYYYRIAQNFCTSGKVTFDGITITNGFHPLWFLIILPIYFFNSNPWIALRIAFWIIFVILILAFHEFLKVGKLMKLSIGGMIIALLIVFLNIRSFTVLFSLIEAPLVLFMYLIYINYVLKVGEKRFTNSKYAFHTGLILGICFLARVDSIFLTLSYGIFLIIWFLRLKIKFSIFFRNLLTSAAGFMLLSVPYLIINYAYFGKIIPVSGSRKIQLLSEWRWLYNPILDIYKRIVPRISFILGVPDRYNWIFLLLICVTMLFLLFLFITGNRWKRIVVTLKPIREFVLFSIIHFLFIYFLMPSEVFVSAWYYISELLIVSLLIAIIIPQKRKISNTLGFVMLLILFAQILFYPTFVRNKKMTWAKIEIAEYVRNNLPKNARLAMADAGITSYYSQRDFVATRGLVGDYETVELIKNQQFKLLMDKYKVDYLIIGVPININFGFRQNEVYVTKNRTKFGDFSQGVKELILYKGTPDELSKIYFYILNDIRI